MAKRADSAYASGGRRSRMIVLNATGHCPSLSAPDEVIAAMRTFV